MRPRCHRALRVAVAIAATLVLSTVSTVRADDEKRETRTISVVGRGEVTAAPDLAVLTLAVETTASTAEEATSENARKSTAVLDGIKRLTKDGDSLKTTGYNLQPRYGDRKPGSQAPPAIVGYIARNQVRVEIHDLDAVGKVLDAALQGGANRSNTLNFLLEHRNPQIRAALALAGAEARAQAESIAEALGVRLGDVLSASTSAPSAPIRPQQSVMTMRAAAEAMPTPVEAGEVHVEATLHVTYSIE